MALPKLILLFSGKRKSGKDYICEHLKSVLQDDCCIIRISGPLKGLYAKNHNLDLKELMGDGPYKETYRLKMIHWSEEIRQKEPGHFCKAASDQAKLCSVWIVSDIRRKTDIKWFKENYGDKIRTVRVSADIDIRKKRGWIFTEGVDDVASECDLDDFNNWNLQISNNNEEQFKNSIKQMFLLIEALK